MVYMSKAFTFVFNWVDTVNVYSTWCLFAIGMGKSVEVEEEEIF